MGEAIGIDLGTTNSGAGYFSNGRATILSTSFSEPITPSVISYDPRRNRVSIGRDAWQRIEQFPDTTIFSIKRLMGRTFDDEDIDKVKAVQERFGYQIVRADDPQDKGIRILLGTQKLSPIEISALILEQVKNDASQALGNQSVTHAVITVPAYFDERQRAATRLAAQKAGLIVKKLIDEPTAAAIAFGMDHLDERHRLLVYDMGGGTFDISLIQSTQQRFQVMEKEGDNWLGGDDFDFKIVTRILAWVQLRYGRDLASDKKFLTAAKKMAEQAKLSLSGRSETAIVGDIKTEDGSTVIVDMDLTREEFRQDIQSYVDSTLKLVQTVLDRRHLTPDDITAVLLVGGSTHIPLIYESLYQVFGQRKVRHDIDPMQCVAIGAGILAARLRTIECPVCAYENAEQVTTCENCTNPLNAATIQGDVHLGDVTAKTIGIEVVRGRSEGGYSRIITKGTHYPTQITRWYETTSDRRIRIPIYQGEGEQIAQNELQAIVEIQLPEQVSPNTPVRITFGLDRDQVLSVGVHVKDHPHLTFKEVVRRDQPRPIPSSEVESTPIMERWQRTSQRVLMLIGNFLEDFGSYLNYVERKKLENEVEQCRTAFHEHREEDCRQLVDTLIMTVLASGTAGQLFLAQRIASSAVAPEEAQYLRQAADEIKVARQGGDVDREQQLVADLSNRVNNHYQVQRERQERSKVQDFKGLLLETEFGSSEI